jgi:hypothetical protein
LHLASFPATVPAAATTAREGARMGIFDFFKRKQSPAAPDAGSPPSGRVEPRCGHYFMAHYALRTVALQHPLETLAMLASPKGYDFLARLLDEVEEVCRDQGRPPPDFTAADLHIGYRRCVGNHPCAVVRFPEPQGTTEAHMVAIVVTSDLPAIAPGAKELPQVDARYFTLEKGFRFKGGAERTVICEWTKTAHLNGGDGPPPTVDAFLAAIEERLGPSSSTATAAPQ